jgi:CRISPR-associated protein Csh1
MIKEITGFINHLPPDFKNLGMKPKEGLHILLRIQQENGRYFMNEQSVVKICSSKKPKPEDEEFLQQCASLSRVAWSVNTNKCFDLPAKGIHSCSPYCVAFKKESLEEAANTIKIKPKFTTA